MRLAFRSSTWLFSSTLLFSACTSDGNGKTVHDAGTALADSGRSDAGKTEYVDAGHPAKDAAVASDAAVDDDASSGSSDSCKLAFDLQFGRGGGFINSSTVADLSPAGKLTVTRTVNGPQSTVTSCAPKLPSCGTTGKLDVSDIVKDLEDPSVKTAFAASTPPFYGFVSPDTGVFNINRADGRSFQVAGGDCASLDASDCLATPAGVAKLVADLTAIEDDALLSSACASL